MSKITKSAIRAALFMGVVYTAFLWFIESQSGAEIVVWKFLVQGVVMALLMGVMQYRTLKKDQNNSTQN